MTTTYAVLFPGNGLHGEFMQLLAERGHTMTGGDELTNSAQAKVLRGTLDQVSVIEGLYAETV